MKPNEHGRFRRSKKGHKLGDPVLSYEFAAVQNLIVGKKRTERGKGRGERQKKLRDLSRFRLGGDGVRSFFPQSGTSMYSAALSFPPYRRPTLSTVTLYC